MPREKRTLTGAFKAKVALEALQEKKSIAQLAKDYDLHSNQISAWKKQLIEQSAHVFEHPQEVKTEAEEKLKDELFKQIGQLRVENEWLKKKSAQFFGQKHA
jgi:transposase